MEDLQNQVLAWILKEDGAMDSVSGTLVPEHFSSSVCKAIYTITLRIWEKTGKIPTREELSGLIAAHLSDDRTPLFKPMLLERLGVVYLQTLAATPHEVSRWLAARELRTSVKDLSATTAGNVEETLGRLQERIEKLEPLLSSSKTVQALTAGDFEQDAEARYTGKPIPLGWQPIDSRIRSKGMMRGELGVVMACTNTGKTHLLLDMTVRLCESGHRVMFLSIDNLRGEVLDRLEARISGLSLDDPKTVKATRQALRAWFAHHGDGLFVQDAAPYQMTTADVRRLVGQTVRRGGLDVIVVDYGDLILSRRRYSEKRQELDMVFTELRGVAKSQGILVITATQANRAALKAPTLTTEHLSECFSKGWHASLIVGIAQSPEERSMSRCRLCIVKNTRGENSVEIPMTVDYGRVRFDPDTSAQVRPFASRPKVAKGVRKKGDANIGEATNEASPAWDLSGLV